MAAPQVSLTVHISRFQFVIKGDIASNRKSALTHAAQNHGLLHLSLSLVTKQTYLCVCNGSWPSSFSGFSEKLPYPQLTGEAAFKI